MLTTVFLGARSILVTKPAVADRKTPMPIIESLLETDLYKFTMWQAFFYKPALRNNVAVYEFKCRNTPKVPLATLAEEISAEIEHFCTLRFKPEEIEYLRSLGFFKEEFLEYLSTHKFNSNNIQMTIVNGRLKDGVVLDGDLQIKAEGYLLDVMGFEIPVLAIVNEVYFRHTTNPSALEEAKYRLYDKFEAMDYVHGTDETFSFCDFGLRRRYSGSWHRAVVESFKNTPAFTGTSNVFLARELKVKPIGTMAHEYLQAYQTLSPLREFQKNALMDWALLYRGKLGIALTDTVGIDAFLNDFDLLLAKIYDGVRHDSGDPVEWAEKVLNHYQKLGIDPKTKTLVFSDGLTPKKAIEIHREFSHKAKLVFGIGTNLTNDTGETPLNIVMKLTSLGGLPVAKLSDSQGKTMCNDSAYVSHLRKTFENP
jgi:nicotinate phosphoribosyltransferase